MSVVVEVRELCGSTRKAVVAHLTVIFVSVARVIIARDARSTA
jgi:hypothetical protein